MNRPPDFDRGRRAARLVGPAPAGAGPRAMAIDAPPHLDPPGEAPVPRSSGRGPIALIVVVGLVLVAIGVVAWATSSKDDTSSTATAPSCGP